MTLGAWVLVTLTRAHRRGTSSGAPWTTRRPLPGLAQVIRQRFASRAAWLRDHR